MALANLFRFPDVLIAKLIQSEDPRIRAWAEATIAEQKGAERLCFSGKNVARSPKTWGGFGSSFGVLARCYTSHVTKGSDWG